MLKKSQVCQNKLEHNKSDEAKSNNILHQDVHASMEETKATGASIAKVSQTLETPNTVFGTLCTAQTAATFKAGFY